MNDPAFWRDLRAQFESLEQPTRFSAGINDPGPWWLTDGPDDSMRRDTLHNRFRTLAVRGSSRATGADLEVAMDSWLDLIRRRAPHHFWALSGNALATTLHVIPLNRINAPEAFEPDGRPVLFVEPVGERFAIVAGHANYSAALALGHETIECRIQEFRETTGGYIRHPPLASMELCEQLETEALGSTATAPDQTKSSGKADFSTSRGVAHARTRRARMDSSRP